MTKQEILLASAMLNLAQEEFSNKGCNDLAEDVKALVTNEKEICESFRKWWGDKESSRPEEISSIGDDKLMHYLSDKLREFADTMK